MASIKLWAERENPNVAGMHTIVLPPYKLPYGSLEIPKESKMFETIPFVTRTSRKWVDIFFEEISESAVNASFVHLMVNSILEVPQAQHSFYEQREHATGHIEMSFNPDSWPRGNIYLCARDSLLFSWKELRHVQDVISSSLRQHTDEILLLPDREKSFF